MEEGRELQQIPQFSLFLCGISNDVSDQWYLEMMVKTSENWLLQKLECWHKERTSRLTL